MNECDYCSRHFDNYNCDRCPFYRSHLVEDICDGCDPDFDLMYEIYAKEQTEKAL